MQQRRKIFRLAVYCPSLKGILQTICKKPGRTPIIYRKPNSRDRDNMKDGDKGEKTSRASNSHSCSLDNALAEMKAVCLSTLTTRPITSSALGLSHTAS